MCYVNAYRVTRGEACAANKIIHIRRYDAAHISVNHLKSDLTARTDLYIISFQIEFCNTKIGKLSDYLEKSLALFAELIFHMS